MIDHDKAVGQLLDAIDEMDLSEDTIVFYERGQRPAYEHLARCRDDTVP